MNNAIEKQLKDAIPIWTWVRLDDADLREYTDMPEGTVVLLHTDHFHLDILWQFPDGEIQNEQAYYDVALEYDSVVDFLGSEIGDDAQHTWEHSHGLAGIIANIHGTEIIDIDALPIVSFLDSKEEREANATVDTPKTERLTLGSIMKNLNLKSATESELQAKLDADAKVEQREQAEVEQVPAGMQLPTTSGAIEIYREAYSLWLRVNPENKQIPFPLWLNMQAEVMREKMIALDSTDKQPETAEIEIDFYLPNFMEGDELQELAEISAIYYLSNESIGGQPYSRIDGIKAWRFVTNDDLRTAMTAVDAIMEWLL